MFWKDQTNICFIACNKKMEGVILGKIFSFKVRLFLRFMEKIQNKSMKKSMKNMNKILFFIDRSMQNPNFARKTWLQIDCMICMFTQNWSLKEKSANKHGFFPCWSWWPIYILIHCWLNQHTPGASLLYGTYAITQTWNLKTQAT